MGPLELEEKNLNKEIEDLLTKIMELEQKWLREQNELVRLVKQHQVRQHELRSQKDNFIVLTTKKLRIESKLCLNSLKIIMRNHILFILCYFREDRNRTKQH